METISVSKRGKHRPSMDSSNCDKFVLVGDMIYSEAWQKFSQARDISERRHHLECVMQQKGRHIKCISKETLVFVQSISHKEWTEVMKKVGLIKLLVCF